MDAVSPEGFSIAAEPTVLRLSLDSAGLEGNNISYDAFVSGDGRYVTFKSQSTNLVAGDTNGVGDIFFRDTRTGSTTRVSVDSAGLQGDSTSYFPSISNDGRYVTFQSNATNLVAGDTNGTYDVFLHDTQTGTTTRLSVDSSNLQGNSPSYVPSISGNGRYVTFHSMATNLVLGDTNGVSDIFLRDTQTGTTTRVSVDSSNLQGNSSSFHSSISNDGRYVTFRSHATNLVAGDTNVTPDIFFRDTLLGATIRISVDSAGLQGNSSSYSPSISGDGRYVSFYSNATNLVAGDTNGVSDIFFRDTHTSTTTRLSVDSTGLEVTGGHSLNPSISGDGRYVTFESGATNLVAGDTNGVNDAFLHDTVTGSTTRLSVDSGGLEGDGPSELPTISDDGRYVTFQSDAANLVAGDTNVVKDIFRVYNP